MTGARMGCQEIPPSALQEIKEAAWSLENMEGHGAGGRTLDYIGSAPGGYLDNDPQKGMLVFDYYQDNMGAYWYESWALMPDGTAISMECYLFGKPVREMRRAHREKGRGRYGGITAADGYKSWKAKG